MNKFQHRELNGSSGRSYAFTLYDGVPRYRARVGGVFLVAKDDGGSDYALTAEECLLIGSSDDLNRALDMLKGSRTYLARNRALFGVMPVHDPALRSAIQADLLEAGSLAAS